MTALIKSVALKMKGFSRKETVAYYKDIIERAWKQVESADTPEVKSAKYDEVMEWTMLDKDYDDRTRRTFSGGPVFVPHWWGNYDPTFSPGSSGPSTVSTSPGGSGSSGGGAASTCPLCPARILPPRWWAACRISPAAWSATSTISPPPSPTAPIPRPHPLPAAAAALAPVVAAAVRAPVPVPVVPAPAPAVGGNQLHQQPYR